jgi:hypothetical protein
MSGGVFILHLRRDRRESINFKNATTVDLAASIEKSKYFEYRNYDQFTGDLDEGFLLQVQYFIFNKSSFPVIIDKVDLIFHENITNKPVNTKSADFSNSLVVVKEGETKRFSLEIRFKNAEIIKEVIGLQTMMRIHVRGLTKSFNFPSKKLEIEFIE